MVIPLAKQMFCLALLCDKFRQLNNNAETPSIKMEARRARKNVPTDDPTPNPLKNGSDQNMSVKNNPANSKEVNQQRMA